MVVRKPASSEIESHSFDDLMDSRWAWAIRSSIGWVLVLVCALTGHGWWAMGMAAYATWAALQKPLPSQPPPRKTLITFGGGPG